MCSLTGLPVEILVPALNGLAALLALTVLYIAARRFVSRAMATAVVALVATSMAMPVWTLAYSDTLGLLGVVVALALLAARRYAWLAVVLTVLAVTRPVMAPLAVVVALDSAYIWRRSTTPTRAAALATTIWAGVTVLIWPVVAWVATRNPLTYWDTEKAYEHPRQAALLVRLGTRSPASVVLLAMFLVVALLVWVAVRAPSDGLSVRLARLARRLPGVPRRGHVHLGLSRAIPAVALSRCSAAGRTRPVTLRAGDPGRLLCAPGARPTVGLGCPLRRPYAGPDSLDGVGRSVGPAVQLVSAGVGDTPHADCAQMGYAGSAHPSWIRN